MKHSQWLQKLAFVHRFVRDWRSILLDHSLFLYSVLQSSCLYTISIQYTILLIFRFSFLCFVSISFFSISNIYCLLYIFVYSSVYLIILCQNVTSGIFFSIECIEIIISHTTVVLLLLVVPGHGETVLDMVSLKKIGSHYNMKSRAILH